MAVLLLGGFVLLMFVSVVTSVVHPVLALTSAFRLPGLADFVGDALVGLGLGSLIGFLRYRLRVKNRRIEEIVDAVASRETISAVRVGWLYVAVHALAGMLAATVVSCFGLPLSSLLQHGAGVVIAHGTTATIWLAGGGGDSGGEGAGLLGLLLIVLVAAILALLAGGAASLGMGGIAAAMTSGAIGAVGKSLGIALVLALTRVDAREPQISAIRRPLRPPPRRDPLTFESAMREFLPGVSHLVHAREQLEDYLRWTRQQGLDPLDPSDRRERMPRYDAAVAARGGEQAVAVWLFTDWLPWALAERARPTAPVPAEATDDAAWLDKLAREVFSASWIRQTFLLGAFTGCVTGGLEAIFAGGLLLLLGR